MDEFIANPAIRYWAIAAVYLNLKMIGNSMVQGFQRIKSKAYAHKEDAAFAGRNATVGNEPEMVHKAAACWRNDLENIPMFLIIGLAFILMGGTARTAGIYFAVFCIARTLHTIFFLLSMQPYRTIAFTLGFASILGLLTQVIMLAF